MTNLRTVFNCDLRTLALVRVCLGLLIIADLISRARDLTAHYTDAGVLPRAALFAMDGASASLHMISGARWVMAALFVFAGAVALALVLGYRSRFAALASWALLISLDARNEFVNQGGDMLLRVLLFWAMFLPIGARFSIDAALLKTPIEDNRHFSVAGIGLLVQVMCVYFFTALLKSDPAWIPDGTAVYYSLYNDTLVAPAGEWLRQFPTVMQGLTYFVWFLEIAAAFLVFSPVLHLPMRLLALALLIGMHVGFLLCLKIGLFPFVSITSLLTLTPSAVWDRLAGRLARRNGEGIRIYYDGGCLFCEKICLILRMFLLLPRAQLAPAQDDASANAVMERETSWVIVSPSGEQHTRWRALAWLVRQSALAGPLGSLLGARWLAGGGDRFYGLVARSRSTLSRYSQVLLPFSRASLLPSSAANVACGLVLVTVLWHSIGTLKVDGVPVPAIVRQVAATLRINLAWTMFAPAPSTLSGWFVPVGTLDNGATADVLTGRVAEPDWDRARYLNLNYPNYRWRKLLATLPLESRVELRPYYLQYLCRRWNADHSVEHKLASIRLYFVAETTQPDGVPPTAQRVLSWRSTCGADPVSEIIDLRRGVLPKTS